MQPDTQISIIIPTYKRLEILRETYSHLTIALKNIVAQIIIINDDKTADIPSSFIINPANTVIINNRGSGAASARNLGAKYAKANLLLFIDDDILVNNDTINSVLLLHEKYDRILSTPIWEYSDVVKELLSKTIFGRFKLLYDYTPIRGEKHREIDEQNNLYDVDSLASFCLSIKRDHYLELNGMDEKFPYAGCEDQDFAARAKKMGFKLILDEDIVVKHNETDRIKRHNWLLRQFNGVQGFVFLCQKFPERKNVPLWNENIPVQKNDSPKLKIKKIVKLFMRQKLISDLLNIIVTVCEQAHLPEIVLFKLYNLQAGIYLNQGFTKSYNALCT